MSLKKKLFGMNEFGYLFRVFTNNLSIIWKPFINNSYKDTELINECIDKLKLLNPLTAKDDYTEFRKSVRTLINSKKLSSFLKDQHVQQVMFVGNNFKIITELFEILLTRNKNLISILKEDKVGDPLPFFLYPKSSGNRIHHVYHLLQLFKMKNDFNFNNYNLIIEFGGGYGSFNRLIKKEGYKNDYLIYDFNDINLLQYYYLKNFYDDVNLNEVSKIFKINLISNNETLKKFLIRYQGQKVLLISHWALSETPIEVRENFIKTLSGVNYDIFLAFQENFNGINNLNYFNKIFKKDEFILKKFTINFERHYYLFK